MKPTPTLSSMPTPGMLSNLKRGAQIMWALGRYRALDLIPPPILPLATKRWLQWMPAHPKLKQYPPHQHLRLLLIELGPLFIKLGQLLATRREWLPEDIAIDLAQLQDQVPGFDPQHAQRIIETELGQSIDTLFTRFDLAPLASASLAQVHTAALPSGEEVVVKVLRPGVRERIAQDLSLFKRLTTLAEKRFPELERLHLTRVAQDYETILRNEVSLINEGIQTQAFYHHFQGSPDLAVPKVYPNLSTDGVLTMERMYGTPINQVTTFKENNIDLSQLAQMGVRIFLKQVFTDNFFHADMHPGNVHVDIRNPECPQYISLDNAIAGTLEPADQLLLARQLVAFMQEDFDELARLMIQAGWVPEETALAAFSLTLRAIFTPLINQPLSQIEFGPVLIRLFTAAERFHLRSLPQFVLLEKTLIHVEGLGTQLDPNLNIWPILRPHMEQFVRRQLCPIHALKTLKQRWPDVVSHTAKVLTRTPSLSEIHAPTPITTQAAPSVVWWAAIIAIITASFLFGLAIAPTLTP